MARILVYLLVTCFVYGFAALWIWAMFPRGSLSVGYRRWEVAGQTIFEQRPGLIGILFGLPLIGIGCVAGTALMNTALAAGWGWHWVLWLPLFAMFGVLLVWLGLFIAAGRFRVVVDRPAGTWRATSYLGPLPFWTRRHSLNGFNAVRTTGRKAPKTGWHWYVSLVGEGRTLEIGCGNERDVSRLTADVQAATGLPRFAGPELRTPPEATASFVELRRSDREIAYRRGRADRVMAIIGTLFCAGFVAASGSSLLENLRGFGWPPAVGGWFEWFLLAFNVLALVFALYLLKSVLTDTAVQTVLQLDRQTHTLERRVHRLLGRTVSQTIQSSDVQEIALEHNDRREWAAVLIDREGSRWTIDHALDEQPIRQLALDAAEALGVACTVVESSQESIPG